MSKAISSYPKEQRTKVADSRLLGKTLGLGYWAAVDYFIALRRKDIEAESSKK